MLATVFRTMSRSRKIFCRAREKIPGGVNSPVRAWKAVGGEPLIIARGQGSRIFDADGRRYIDFVGSWGPLILGHAHPRIVQAVKRRAAMGFTFGAPTEAEVRLAEMVARIVPSIELLRLVSSGTEAAMSAMRLARAFTGKRKIIKFDGCYHGHADGLLVKAGSGVATLGLPDSPGVPPSYARETLIAKYNDITSVQRIMNAHRSDIAAIIVEPICGNMGVIPPEANFLRSLRQITRQSGALLIFDEVITGFRVARGGAQEIFQIKPDLTCLGKILGGGFPLAAFGGTARIMKLLAPAGAVYQAGTLSGNPMAVSAGIATLEALSRQRHLRIFGGKSALPRARIPGRSHETRHQSRAQPCRLDDDPVFRAWKRCTTRTTRAGATVRNSPAIFTACCAAGSIFHRLRSRPCLSPRPIPVRI